MVREPARRSSSAKSSRSRTHQRPTTATYCAVPLPVTRRMSDPQRKAGRLAAAAVAGASGAAAGLCGRGGHARRHRDPTRPGMGECDATPLLDDSHAIRALACDCSTYRVHRPREDDRLWQTGLRCRGGRLFELRNRGRLFNRFLFEGGGQIAGRTDRLLCRSASSNGRQRARSHAVKLTSAASYIRLVVRRIAMFPARHARGRSNQESRHAFSQGGRALLRGARGWSRPMAPAPPTPSS